MEPTSTAMSGVDIVSNVIPALMIVLGAPLGIWLWTRRSRNSSVNRLRITDKAALGKSLWVAVVEIDEQRFLVGAGDGSVGLISQLADAAPATEDVQETVAETAAADPLSTFTNGITERPRMGLVQRLQQMTLRTSPRSSTRPFYASRR